MWLLIMIYTQLTGSCCCCSFAISSWGGVGVVLFFIFAALGFLAVLLFLCNKTCCVRVFRNLQRGTEIHKTMFSKQVI